jgi:signal peptidase II
MKKYFALSFIFILLDQITKYFLTEKYITITSFFSFRYAENTGTAFSILQNQNLLLIFISIIVIIGCIYYFKQYKLALTFVLAGAIGNLLDRIFLGFVRDFIAISIWPIFNLADSFNTIGIILLIYAFYREDKTYKQSTLKKR